MKQYEAVMKVMEENGGYSTLNNLYQKVLLVKNCKWETQTPYASIRRIVQDKRFFFKIKPGLWALKNKKPEVLRLLKLDIKDKESNKDFSHTYYQGLLIEIGNMKNMKTYVPAQDQNKLYLNMKLHEMITLSHIFPFTYENIIKKAQTVDVSWFNHRCFPHSFFEVEHTSDIYNSLLKYTELQDFYTLFYIVGDKNRKREYQTKLSMDVFNCIATRVKFMDYDYLSSLHAKVSELFILEKDLY